MKADILSEGMRFMWRGLLVALLLVVPFAAYAADFNLKDMQGKPQRLADYRGKWVLVNFWATWCPPCLNEIPELVSLHKAHKDKDLVVIGIAVDSGSEKAVAEFVKAHGVTYPMVMEDDKVRRQLGEMDVLPTSYLYNPKGELVSYQQGEVTRESVETYIKNKK
ncbi:MAG TPA: TlpA disulfide reductase family protein [Gallionella sp.]|nr:TlpA disulfide reductase family protein [Gallionella sp.]